MAVDREKEFLETTPLRNSQAGQFIYQSVEPEETEPDCSLVNLNALLKHYYKWLLAKGHIKNTGTY